VAAPAPGMLTIQRPGQVSPARMLAWLQWRVTSELMLYGER
jgi:hypothetical protein